MRIIAGDYGGRQLSSPRGLGTRPTSDRVRQAVFNILGAPLRRDGAPRFRVLDLFAGSGAMGLEALSRGADEVVLVEQDREAARVAQENVETLGVRGRARVMQREVGETLRKLDGEFDWIFLDPPYDKPALRETIAADQAREAAKPGSRPTPHREQRGGYGGLDRALRLLARTSLPAGLVIAEHGAQNPPADRYKGASISLVLVDRRAWGTTGVSFYRPEAASAEGAPDGDADEPGDAGDESPSHRES